VLAQVVECKTRSHPIIDERNLIYKNIYKYDETHTGGNEAKIRTAYCEVIGCGGYWREK
jgi:hypothetical protein